MLPTGTFPKWSQFRDGTSNSSLHTQTLRQLELHPIHEILVPTYREDGLADGLLDCRVHVIFSNSFGVLRNT